MTHVVATDGLTVATTLKELRLWKREPGRSSILLDHATRTVFKLNTKGNLLIREMTGQYHDHGYDLAREAMIVRAAVKSDRGVVLTAIGKAAIVMNIKTMSNIFAAAA